MSEREWAKGPTHAVQIEREMYRQKIVIRMARFHSDGGGTAYVDGGSKIAHYREDEHTAEAYQAFAAIPEDAARTLYDGLRKFFDGQDVAAKVSRDDLLHERTRVDKLTDALIRLSIPASP